MGLGLQQLEEALLFQAELMDLKASQSRPAVGVVIEAKMDKGQGAVATVIVKQGTLKVRTFTPLRRAAADTAVSLSCRMPDSHGHELEGCKITLALGAMGSQ